MNLLTHPWIPVRYRDGSTGRIEPWRISDSTVVEIVAPRPDFTGALYQFCIGLMQTGAAPEDMEDWEDGWNSPPSPDELKERLAPLADVFRFGPETPSFMQDYQLPECEAIPVAALLIDTSGGGTYFVKEGTVNAICPVCAATALFTLQTNAPSGGRGYRTGLRGGGPLSTLVLPDETEAQPASLWERIWLNVIPEDSFMGKIKGGWDKRRPEDKFPWLAPTRASEGENAGTFPEDAHPYQMFWGMPRRIRFDFAETVSGVCDLCGETGDALLTQYRTKNYGVSYTGPWTHPFSPHNLDPKKEKPPLPLHGNKGCVSYRHWPGFVLDSAGNRKRALVVGHYVEEKLARVNFRTNEARLWIFGYDMDNMKARCWYEGTMPVLHVREEAHRDALLKLVPPAIDAAAEMASNLRNAVKKAWFTRPGDARGDMSFLDSAFWRITETDFFICLRDLAARIPTDEPTREVLAEWFQRLRRSAMDLFDEWALSGPLEDQDMERITTARRDLGKWLNVCKPAKKTLDLAKGEAA